METRKESKLLNFVIFLIAVSLFAMGAFMYLKGKETDKDTKDNDIKEEVKTDDKDENTIKEISEDDAKKIVDKYFRVKNPYIFSDITNNGLTNELKLKIALLNSEYTDEYKCSDLFEVSGIYNAYFKSSDETSSWGCMDNEKTKTYMYDELNESYKILFGKNENAIKEGFDGVPTIDYSTNVDAYVILNPRFNPVYEELYIYDVISYKQDEEKLDIVISYISYTNDYKDKNLIYNVKLNDESESFVANSVEEIALYYANNKNDASKLTLSFIYEDDYYILKNIVK